MKLRLGVFLALVIVVLTSLLPGCQPTAAADGYVAVIPKILHSGGKESFSLALFQGEQPVSGTVEVSLLKENKEVFQVKKGVDRQGTIEFEMPQLEEGKYDIRIRGDGFDDRAAVQVEKSFLIFVETDKPIYKPGQDMRVRIITLDAELRPVSEAVTLEVLDAKGIKVFRREMTTDDYGMASLDFPISAEPNLGTWKLSAVTPKGKTQLDVRIEKYVLPKYEVKAELEKEWFLVNEPIKGKVSAIYSFGKPVKGELIIKASRYVGTWQEYAQFSKTIDGDTEFNLPAVGYVAGVPEARGMGNVMLDISVKEKSTGYEEKTSEMLTVAQTPTSIQIIPEGNTFKPGLPFSILFVTETPDNKMIDATLNVTVSYINGEFNEEKKEQHEVKTSKGKAILDVNPPEKAIAMTVESFELSLLSSVQPASASKVVEAAYSPSGNFIHLEQLNEGIPQIGAEARFKVNSTSTAANFYYEVVARDRVVFSDFTRNAEFSFKTTPLMAPSAKLLVYQILPNSEVAADYLPFDVQAAYPQDISVAFNKDEAKPGDNVSISVTTEGAAKVGLVAVDKSVYILAENRLNMAQVFAELERLYMDPQAELHEVTIYPAITTKGAQDVFDRAGVVVLSNNKIPQGQEYQSERQPGFWGQFGRFFDGGGFGAEKGVVGMPPPAPMAPGATNDSQVTYGESVDLAEVQRIRQYFPETWLWEELTTGFTGKGSLSVQVPDSITTWMLRAVAVSKENGLGMAEDTLKAFQPFFTTVDLPYAAIRGEEFPVKVAIYNYLDKAQNVQVEIERQDWFDLLDETKKSIEIAASDIGGAEFKIRPNKLGTNSVKITIRSPEAADAVIQKIIVEPEGVAREVVENLVLADGGNKVIETTVPPLAVVGSGRAYITVTSSYLTQTIEGLDALIQMPYGCGEQNMLLLAPDIYITRYLTESGQLKPEIMAKAEKLMITGYQREMTYRRSDGSFSAFGESDESGSLWLTAFVLKSFAQAKSLIYIDESVLDGTADWITSHQNADGSFDAVGFVHHQELLGGMQGKDALTAYAAIALMESGNKAGADKAIAYLEGKLDGMTDAYGIAITAYALELAQSDKANGANQKLMQMAKEDENGLHWGDDAIVRPEQGNKMMPIMPPQNQSAAIETTAYAMLSLVKHGDAANAAQAARWLISKRNAYGGYGSTQDTVVTLQALTEYASGIRADVDLTVNIKMGSEQKQLKINQSNFDVLQVVEIPVGENVEVSVKGKGEAIAQVVRRYNIPQAEEGDKILKVNVSYDSSQVEVNDVVTVSAQVEFNPPVPMEAGMVVLDVSVPTGFQPLTDSIETVLQAEKRIKRYEVAGRKVIFYIENMQPGDKVAFTFQVKALYPVKAKGVTSQAYSYYKPEIRGETLGRDITVQ